jgi:16S rRNA G966 N2-methylase RsmD
MKAVKRPTTSALALPDSQHSPLPEIRTQCRQIYDRRDDIIDVWNLENANSYRLGLNALEKFVGNREGRDDVRRSARILECAVGAALGPPEQTYPGKNTSLAGEALSITADDRYRCRLLFEHRGVWEPVLQERGLSRSQALTLIKLKRQAEGERASGLATIDVADAIAWLAEQPSCDLLLTDPPYATDVEDIATFARQWLPRALAKVHPTGRAYVCIGAYPHELAAYLSADRAGLTLAQVLVWTYRNTLGPAPSHDYKQNWQAILYFRGPDAPALECPLMTEQFSVQDLSAPDGRRGDRYHAWQKPDDLAERFIRHATKPGDLVLDPFAGTGTFLLAAARLGRDATGCDVDPDQVAVCLRRGCRDGRQLAM